MWKVTTSPWTREDVPAPWAIYRDADPIAGMWLPTCVAELAVNQGVTVTVRDSWTAEGVESAGARLFSDRLRDALAGMEDGADPVTGKARLREGADPVVYAVLKSVYRSAYGYAKTLDANRTLWRPDWYATVIAAAWANTARKIYDAHKATLCAPVAVHVDAVTYPSTDPNPRTACPPLNGERETLGTGIGQFHIELMKEAGSDEA
jgi:hypothetical protein